MHVQHRLERIAWQKAAAVVGTAVLIFLLRFALREMLIQVAAAYLLMTMALPICRALEKRIDAGWAATLSFFVLALAGITLLLLFIPPVVRQFRQLSELLPEVLNWGGEQLTRLEAALRDRGYDVTPMRDRMAGQLQESIGGLVSGIAERVQQAAGSVGKLFLAPLFAFYLLRDRRRISARLTLLFPIRYRTRIVRAAREMRRETVGFLRGQLILSGFVGVLTAAGLLVVGTPGWLLLGLMMGVLELVPYIGPILAGIPAVLLALQAGWLKVLWTLGVLIAVQQIEGTFLSPRLLSGATRLHPLAVLLIISMGGFVAGTWGMLLSLPLVVSARGAVRGFRE